MVGTTLNLYFYSVAHLFGLDGYNYLHCWATICKTVRPVLLDHCPVSLSVTLVYCGQTVGWMKMKLGVQVE